MRTGKSVLNGSWRNRNRNRHWASSLALLGFVGVGLIVVGSFVVASPMSQVESRPKASHGVAAGDATTSSAVIWSRADRPSYMNVEILDQKVGVWRNAGSLWVDESTDLTGKIRVEGLSPGENRYRVSFSLTREKAAGGPATEGKVQIPLASPNALKILWGADLGGHGEVPPFPILETMSREKADVFVFLGDTVYADTPPHYYTGNPNHCPTPAATLEEFRCKYKELRVDPNLQTLLKTQGTVAIWDDHEVRDNFEGPTDPLMPLGRRVFLEYWPICPPQEESTRLYRSFRWGDIAEIFVLDTRTYRDPNRSSDSPTKTMLGQAQLSWLTDSITASTADYKFVINSLPISIPILNPFARDGWANGPGLADLPLDPTGFEQEFRKIANLLESHENIYFLSADAHYAHAISYDSNGDSSANFREFVTGPLAALRLGPQPLDPSFGPTSLYAEGPFYNYGVATVGPDGVTVEIKDETGSPHYSATFADESPPRMLATESLLPPTTCHTARVQGLHGSS